MKIYGIIKTVIYLALTALVIAFVSSIAEIEVLRYFIGGLIIFYGVEEIVFTVFKNKKHYSIHTIFWNIIEIFIGLVVIVFVETGDIEVTYAVVCVCWAIWSILREARELAELIKEIKEQKPVICRVVNIISLLESLTVVAFSLTMLIEPGEHHAKIHLYLLAAELFTKAAFPLIKNLVEKYGKKQEAQVEEVATEQTEQPENTEQPEQAEQVEHTENTEHTELEEV